MNKNIKLSIIASSVIAVLAVGGIGYRVDQLQKKRDYFQDKFTKNKSMLPEAIVIEKTSQSSLFSTDSIYTITIKKTNHTTNKLIINTHLQHGLSYLFSGVIEGTSVGKIVGPFTKEFKSLDKLFDSRITVLADDTLITDTTFVDLTAKDGYQFNGMTSYFETTKNDELIKTNFKIASINSPKLTDGKSMFNLKGFDLQYTGKSNDIGNNHFSAKISDIKSPFAQINNMSLIADSTVKSGLVDLTSSLSIAKINADKWQNGSVDFKYSVVGLDQKAIESIYNIGKKTASNNETEIQKNIHDMENQVRTLFTRGFEARVDKLAFKSGDDNFNFSFKATLPRAKSFDDVSVEKNLHVLYNLETKGSFSDTIAQAINVKLQDLNLSAPTEEEPIELVTVNAQELKVAIEIAESKGNINGKEFSKNQNEMLHIILSTFDEKLHDKKIVTTEKSIEPVAQQESTSGLENTVVTKPTITTTP